MSILKACQPTLKAHAIKISAAALLHVVEQFRQQPGFLPTPMRISAKSDTRFGNIRTPISE
jgi:hypothetical protein